MMYLMRYFQGVKFVDYQLKPSLYFSDRTYAMIGAFSVSYLTVRPTKFKSFFWSPKYLFKKNLRKSWEKLEEKYANEKEEQNSETDIPNFRVGFLEFLSKTSDK